MVDGLPALCSLLVVGTLPSTLIWRQTHFLSTREGVRQDDPLSLFLFNIVVDGSAAIMYKVRCVGHLCAAVAHLIAVGGVSHLQYADDTILMWSELQWI